MNPPLLSGHHLTLKMGDRTLFKDCSFALEASMCLGLSGPSGQGKSTFLKGLAGLIPFASGQVKYQQQDITTLEKPHYRKQVLYVPQTPQLQGGSVQEALDYPLSLRMYRHHTMQEIAPEALGLPANISTQRLQHLSGGERQRIQLWRALRLNPTILLLDEPTSALDKSTQEQVESLLRDWLKGSQKACVWISHDTLQLQRMGSTLLYLHTP